MGFLAPWFLAGIAAVGLPVWIHLLKRHKTDPRLFPSLMLFEKREQSSVKHRRLEHLLLFALRVAMLVLLALLFANPFIRRLIPPANNKRLTIVAVDNSFSMRAGDRLAQAKDQATRVLSNLKPGDQAQVIALGGQVQALTQLISDLPQLRAAVNAIAQTDSRASYGELARYLRTLSQSTHMPLEVHLASDMQKSAMPPGFMDVRLDPNTTLVIHQVGKAEPNWTVENVVAPRRIYDPKRVRLAATIAGFGTPAAKRTVSLVLNGKVLQTKAVDVGEGGRAQAEFLALDAPYGFSRGEVRIDSADVLPADDSFPFAVERTDPRKVLFIDDGRHPNAVLYFKAALDSTGDSAFQLETMRAEQAASSQLSHYSFVVLNNLGSMPGGFDDALRTYVRGGGSALVVLGPASVAMAKVPITGETIESSSYAGREGERFLAVSEIDTGHPVLRSVERFGGVKFYQAVRVTPSKSVVMARLNDQTPLVLEQQMGEGKVLVLASTFDKEPLMNDLPLHASWVPFVVKSAEYLGGGGTEQQVDLAVDSYVELRSANSKGAAAEVLDPDGKRLLSLEQATSATNFQVSREGFFELRTAAGRQSLIAAHADRRESDLTLIPPETLDLWKATGSSDTSASAASNSGNPEQKQPWGLWPILLLLLLLVAVTESVVADRYLRPPVEKQEGAKKEAA
jgi:hypothetical protein